ARASRPSETMSDSDGRDARPTSAPEVPFDEVARASRPGENMSDSDGRDARPTSAFLSDAHCFPHATSDPRDPKPQSPNPNPLPKWTVASDKLAAMHRMSIGTITSDTSMFVKYLSGK